MRAKGSWRKWVPRKRSHRILVGLGVVLLLGVALVASGLVRFPRLEEWLGGDSQGGTVVVTSPNPGETVTAGSRIDGNVLGDGSVYVWVKGVNFAVPAERSGTGWTYHYGGGLKGEKTLVFGLNSGGAWSPLTEIRYVFSESEPPPGGAGEENGFFRSIFRPVGQAVDAVVAFVTGRGSGDLDQNGVPDKWQGQPNSPTGPRIQYLNLTTAIALVAFVLVGGYWWKGKELHEYLLRRKVIATKGREARARLRLEYQRQKLAARGSAAAVRASIDQEKVRAAAAIQAEAVKVKGAAIERQQALQAEALRVKAAAVERQQAIQGEVTRGKLSIIMGRIRGRA